MMDLVHNIGIVSMIVPSSNATTVTGISIDLSGFESAVVAIQVAGVAADETLVVKLQDSNTDSNYVDVVVDNTNILGDVPTYAPGCGASVNKFGYIGGKKYIKLIATIGGTTPAIILGAICVKGDARRKPIA